MTRYLVTSALPYANGPIHFGHIIGAYLPADVYVRYRRMRGDDVMFICGTDEHGVAITINAEAQGKDYGEFVKHWRNEIKTTFDAFNIKFGYGDIEQFSGTSSCPPHKDISQQFFKNLDANQYLNKKTEKQWYCETNQMFLADRYLEGTCPFCGAPNARGDECKKCGQWIDALNLKNPICKLCGNAPIVKETEHWYLDLPKLHEDGLGKWFE
ncbi:MAG: class I tRNA ligase family protein, partial [Planctomycetota bacterium]